MVVGLDLASGAFATASIALQLADVALKLHSFWKSVKGAPRDLNDLANDLMLLHGIFKDVHLEQKAFPGPCEALPTHNALLRCEVYLEELESLARKLQTDMSKGKLKRTWHSVKVVFKQDQIDKFKRSLESMKVTLLLARQSLTAMLSNYQTTVFSSGMASLSSQQLETAQTIRALESKLEQDTSVIVKTLQSGNRNAYPGALMATLESTIKSYVREGFRESFQELQKELETSQKASLKEVAEENDAETTQDVSSEPPKAPDSAIDSCEDSVTSPSERTIPGSVRTSCRKIYDVWLGQIEIAVSLVRKASAKMTYGSEKRHSEQVLGFSFTFKPKIWLMSPGVWRISGKHASSGSGHDFSFQPTYCPRVSYKAPIFDSCRTGNVSYVLQLLDSGQASIYDMDEWGRSLLHIAARSQNVALVKALIHAGCVKGAIDEFGNSPLDMITFTVNEDDCNTLVVPQSRLLDIMRLLIEEADCDPNFEYHSNRCGNNLLQNLCKYRRVLNLPELTPLIHYLLTQESFELEGPPRAISDTRNFAPLSDMLYHTENEVSVKMSHLLVRHKVDATFVAEFGYSVMQDALMQGHDLPILRSLMQTGAWLHTRNEQRQTPTRIAWWKAKYGKDDIPFGLYRNSRPPSEAYDIFDYLLEADAFSLALQECNISLWEFARNEAKVLASDDKDEPMQYLTVADYHRQSVDTPRATLVVTGSFPYRRRSHGQFEL